MKKVFAVAAATCLIGTGAIAFSAPAQADAQPTLRAAKKPGKACPKKNKTVTTAKYGKLKCVKTGGKLKWKKAAKSAPKPPNGIILLPAAPALPWANG